MKTKSSKSIVDKSSANAVAKHVVATVPPKRMNTRNNKSAAKEVVKEMSNKKRDTTCSIKDQQKIDETVSTIENKSKKGAVDKRKQIGVKKAIVQVIVPKSVDQSNVKKVESQRFSYTSKPPTETRVVQTTPPVLKKTSYAKPDWHTKLAAEIVEIKEDLVSGNSDESHHAAAITRLAAMLERVFASQGGVAKQQQVVVLRSSVLSPVLNLMSTHRKCSQDTLLLRLKCVMFLLERLPVEHRPDVQIVVRLIAELSKLLHSDAFPVLTTVMRAISIVVTFGEEPLRAVERAQVFTLLAANDLVKVTFQSEKTKAMLPPLTNLLDCLSQLKGAFNEYSVDFFCELLLLPLQSHLLHMNSGLLIVQRVVDMFSNTSDHADVSILNRILLNKPLLRQLLTLVQYDTSKSSVFLNPLRMLSLLAKRVEWTLSDEKSVKRAEAHIRAFMSVNPYPVLGQLLYEHDDPNATTEVCELLRAMSDWSDLVPAVLNSLVHSGAALLLMQSIRLNTIKAALHRELLGITMLRAVEVALFAQVEELVHHGLIQFLVSLARMSDLPDLVFKATICMHVQVTQAVTMAETLEHASSEEMAERRTACLRRVLLLAKCSGVEAMAALVEPSTAVSAQQQAQEEVDAELATTPNVIEEE